MIFNIRPKMESGFQRFYDACANYEISVWQGSTTRVILQSFKCNQELSLKWPAKDLIFISIITVPHASLAKMPSGESNLPL